MEAPYTIASLPKPLDAEHGAIQASPVYGIKGSRKRKRHEVAVGIDGEGVNVYNVQSQSLVTSYALPTETYICCPPCSVYVRRPKPAGAQRRTYLVLRSGPTDSKRRLLCLTEEVHSYRQVDDGLQTPKKSEQKLQDGDILGIDVVASQSDETEAGPQVVISYRDGRIEFLDGHLKTSLWNHDAAAKSLEPSEVEHVGLTELDAARKGFLAGREDVIAGLETMSGAHTGNALLLYRITRSGSQRSLELFSMRATSRDHIQSQNPGLQHLLTYNLPAPKHKSSRHAIHELHAASGKAYQLLNGRLTVYDLTGTIPRIVTTFGSSDQRISSCCRISGSAVLTVQVDEAVVYETRYGSVQASVALATSLAAANAGQKRKRTDQKSDTQDISWRAISSFADIGLVVGLSGTEVMAFQVTEDLQRGKLARSDGPLLSEVLGKGAAANLVQKPSNNKAMKKLEEFRSNVNAVFSGGNIAEIEALVAKELGLELESPERFDQDSAVMDVDGEAGDISFEPDDIRIDTAKLDRKRVLYLVSKLFRIVTGDHASAAESDRLVTTIQSDTIYEWLALAGLLTQSNVQQALHLRGDLPGGAAIVRPGDVMSTLKTFDNTFQLIHDLLEDDTFFELAELVQALRLLIQSLETPAEGVTKLLPAPATQAKGDVAMVNGDAESHADSETMAAERELELAISALQNGLEVRSETLRLVLGRLVAFPNDSVTNTMRAMLRQEELVFFMKILRLELLEGSWQQRYIVPAKDAEHDAYGRVDDDDAAPSDRALSHISTLMSCVINAIGISGWLVGQSADVYGMCEFVQELKAEVSASMEGLYENDTLGVFVEMLELFESSTRQRAQGKRGSGSDGPVLPLGFKAEALEGTAKEGKKSHHQVAVEARARIGSYAFERIRI